MFVLAATHSTWRVFGVLTPLDIAVVVLLLAGVAIGYWKGLVWQLICLGSVIASSWVSYLYHPIVAQSLGSQFSEPVRRIGSALGVFVLALLMCYLVAFLLRDLINVVKPKMLDRILGGALGLLTAGLFVGVFAFAVLQYAGQGEPVRTYVQESRGATTMATVVRAFVYLLPGRIRERIPPGSDFACLDQQPALEPSSGLMKVPHSTGSAATPEARKLPGLARLKWRLPGASLPPNATEECRACAATWGAHLCLHSVTV